METYNIKKNSTLPEIKFPLTERLMQQFDITEDMMDNVAITFSMIDNDTGLYQIANTEARLDILDNVYERIDDHKYTLVYRLKLTETTKAGRFAGEFKLDFLGENCGKISLPVDDEIQIIIGNSITKTTVL